MIINNKWTFTWVLYCIEIFIDLSWVLIEFIKVSRIIMLIMQDFFLLFKFSYIYYIYLRTIVVYKFDLRKMVCISDVNVRNKWASIIKVKNITLIN